MWVLVLPDRGADTTCGAACDRTQGTRWPKRTASRCQRRVAAPLAQLLHSAHEVLVAAAVNSIAAAGHARTTLLGEGYLELARVLAELDDYTCANLFVRGFLVVAQSQDQELAVAFATYVVRGEAVGGEGHINITAAAAAAAAATLKNG